MPLSMKSKWSYSVKTDFSSAVDEIVVGRRVPVGSHLGYELIGQMGISRLVWDGDTLLASELGNHGFSPPIPIFATRSKQWKGNLTIAGRPQQGSATLELSETPETIAGREYKAVVAELDIETKGRHINMKTWYVKSIGILRQEQRTDGKRDRRLEYLSGP